MPVPATLDVKGMTTDDLCELIMSGKYLTEIAQMWGVSKTTLLAWIAADPDRSAREIKARNEQGEHWDKLAEMELWKLSTNATKAEVARARELAQHYRWRSSKISVKYRPLPNETNPEDVAIVIHGGLPSIDKAQ